MSQIQISEIYDWWEDAREIVADACQQEADAIKEGARDLISDHSFVEFISSRKETLQEAESYLVQKVGAHNRLLAERLEASLEFSRTHVENSAAFSERTWGETGLLASSVGAAAGAAGLAVGAAAWLPVSTTVFFVVPATFGSWPIFLTLGAGALVACYASPTLSTWAHQKLKDRILEHLDERIDMLLTDRSEGSKSSAAAFFRQLDEARDKRIEEITS